MITEEAIRRIADHMEVHRIGEYPHIRIAEALNMAIDALRAQDEAEKNEPLTLEELQELVWRPVWVERHDFGMSEYAIVRDTEILGFVSFATGTGRIRLPCSVYGRNWMAYRRKPEEAAL